MKFAVSSLALFVAGALGQLMINTPTGALSAIQCLTYQITWTGGQGPFDVRLLDASQNLVEIITSSAASSPLPWTVNEPSGQSFIFSIHDSTGASSSSAPFVIETSTNSACLSAGASSAASTAASSSTGSAPASSAAGSSTAASSTTALATTAASTSAASTPVSTASAISTPATASLTRPASSASVVSPSVTPSQTPSSATKLSAGLLATLFAASIALAA